MKTFSQTCSPLLISALAMAAALNFSKPDALAATGRTVVVTAPVALKHSPDPAGSNDEKILIEAIEPDEPGGKAGEVSWLGVSTEECSEALASQLGLSAGAGLLVTYIAPDSPAAKAGLQKNDVLAEFERQLLVHPAQFRKLIQMRKEGDTVKLTLYRAGKKQTLEATIGKTSSSALGLFWKEHPGDRRVIQRRLQELPLGEAMREQMKNLRDSLAHAGIDKETLNLEVQRSVEEVRKAIQEALRQATNAHRTFGPAAREFRELARRGLDVEKDATVVVKSKRNSVKSIVKTDDTGTYVIVASPQKQLTAHDKSGKLLFDGQIETPEEQDKVPREVWDKVKPMIEQLKDDKAEQEKPEEDSDGT